MAAPSSPTQVMLRSLVLLAGIACTGSAAAVASAPASSVDAGGARQEAATAVVDRCFQLRDSNPAEAVRQADAVLASLPLEPADEIKLRLCLGRSLALAGQADRAQAEVARVDALLALHPMPPEFVLRAMSNAGATLHTLGWTQRALEYYRRALDAARRGVDSDLAQASILVNVGSIHSEALGAHAQAEALYAQAAAAYARADGTSPLLPYNRGQNFLRMGRPDRALEQFGQAERHAAEDGHALVEHRARAERIALEAARDAPPMDAREAMDRLATIARQQQDLEDPAGEATTLVRLSGVALAAGAPRAALVHAERAASLVDDGVFGREQQEALAAQVAAHAAMDDWRAAYDDLQQLRGLEVEALRRNVLDNLAGLQASLQDTEREHEVRRLQDAQRIEALSLQSARRLRNVSIGAFVAVLVLGAAFALYQRRVNRRLSRLSHVDPLTGLLNRRAATRRLQGERARVGDDDRRDAVFLIDIDHFKVRNDRYGHAAGDAALAQVAERLRACCRPEDIVARWGGEEFLVGCRQLDLERAQLVAERLRSAVAGSLAGSPEGGEADLTVSIGFAPHPFFPDATAPGGWQDAVALADRALYAAKHGGRDAWVGLWGRAGCEASFTDVGEDPVSHATRGDIQVVASRTPVRWKARDLEAAGAG